MDNLKPTNRYFEPINAIANSLLHKIDDIPDEKIRNFRQNFLEQYQTSTEPNPKQKEWKRILAQEPIQNLKLAEAPQIKEFESPRLPGGDAEYSGVATIEENHVSYWIRQDIHQQGVKFCPFERALKDDLIDKENLDRITSFKNVDKFGLISMGAANHSLCLSIPKGMHFEKPFLIKVDDIRGNVLMPIIINVFTGEESAAEIIFEMNSTWKKSEQTLISVEANIFIEKSSKIGWVETQSLNANTHLFPTQHFFLKQNASLNYLLIEHGGGVVKRNTRIDLEGMGAETKVTGLYRLKDTQSFVFNTEQNHLASGTRSDLLFKGVLDDASYSLWKGNVFVANKTTGADGYQLNNNLLLDPKSHAESIPGLEINTDDVRCSHGVTISDIDPNELFYLKSRGIDEKQSTELIVDGFSRDALQRVGSQNLKNYAMGILNFS